ncbi:hypothetical protein H4582DRAFT_2178227 [Lactarius indigo]|nr:hypothetical protein H4582DRAFT_2178227 [Lactarius indigo]
MQSDHLSGSSAGESEVSCPSIHALGDRFSITSQDAHILKGYVEEFQNADTEIRKTILEKAMGELYTLQPPNSTFNKKMAKMSMSGGIPGSQAFLGALQDATTSPWKKLSIEEQEPYAEIAKEWSEDRPPRDIQAKMAQAKFRSQIVRDFQTQLFKTCGMRSIVLVAYADTDGRPRAAMDDWNKVLDDGMSFSDFCPDWRNASIWQEWMKYCRKCFVPENDQGAHSWCSKVLQTKVKIVIDTDGEPDIPSVTPEDGYSAKTIQTVLRDYCNSHILLNNISVPVARPLEATPEGGVDPTNLEPVLISGTQNGPPEEVPNSMSQSLTIKTLVNHHILLHQVYQDPKVSKHIIGFKEELQLDLQHTSTQIHQSLSKSQSSEWLRSHTKPEMQTLVGVQFTGICLPFWILDNSQHFLTHSKKIHVRPVVSSVLVTTRKACRPLITEWKSLHGKHVFHVSYYMGGMSSVLVTTRKSLNGRHVFRVSHYMEGISSVFGHYTESKSSVSLHGKHFFHVGHYIEVWTLQCGHKSSEITIWNIILPLARVWRQPDVRKVIKQHIIVLKPNAFPSLYDWVSYPITLLIKSIYDVERKRICKGLTPCHMHVELVAALERALCFCHTGNAAVFATGLMGPLGLSKGALKDGFPMLQDLFEHPTIKQAMEHGLVIAHRKWPLKNGYPAMASKKAQVLSYSMRHFHVYGLSLIRGTF